MSGDHLPTFQGGEFSFAAFRESVLATLNEDSEHTKLGLMFYAVTDLGWSEFRTAVTQWRSRGQGRQAIAYIGTDHAITDPLALQRMASDRIDVRLMMRYSGIYHPKVVWLSSDAHHIVWVGSNNLTREGLRNNIECATVVKSADVHPHFLQWVEAIDRASSPLTNELLADYQKERDTFGATRVNVGTFTWSKKQEPQAPPAIARAGDLVVEVMPRETGQGGKQVQLPKPAIQFFGLPNRVGASRSVRLTYAGGINPRTLTMRIFSNLTVRLVLNELDYRDRPCVLVFNQSSANRFEYEIVQRSIEPVRYRQLLQLCTRQTRTGSRRWGIA